MSYKENETMGTTSSIPVKPEPQEFKIAPLTASSSWKNVYDSTGKDITAVIKPEPTNTTRIETLQASASKREDTDDVKNGTKDPVSEAAKATLYTVYESVTDISYAPEDALMEGLNMVKTIKDSIKNLQLGSKLRHGVWLRDIESLQSQGAPTTLIAVCGATGAGKSSILNAILDDNIVPTSGMRACTAVVTEIAHHLKQTIDADVSFLSEHEWRQELGVLLHDLVDEDGNLKRSTDLKSDAGVAWQKVHAVYPMISQEQLVTMTVDQIISRDANVAKILGATKNIVAKDSKAFSQEIGKYIDSKDRKRGKDKNKDKGGEKKKDDKDAPALWPLIRQVNVRCPSAALSTGAVLVDLPGVADANAARNSIAKDYMKKCDCIWILAPITRAVDDKTARDLLGDAFKMQLMNGNYDAHAITFIASKCDDISCSEVIRALNLDDDPELEDIEERISQYARETREWKHKKTAAEQVAKNIDVQLEDTRECLREYEFHLKALENGDALVPLLTCQPDNKSKRRNGTKRKSSYGSKQGSPKKRRDQAPRDGDDDHIMSDDIDDDPSMDVDSDSADSDEPSDIEEDDDDASKSGSDVDEDESEVEEQAVTVDSLNKKIDASKMAIKNGREQLFQARKQKKDAADHLATLKKNQVKAQREKNAFCSLKRSAFSRDVLKEDFRVGLKDLDDSAAEERDPNNFNPSVNIRDYDAIDLPVFTCSARDYVRLTRQVKGDGDPTCFLNVADTGIPELQNWCQQLTVSSREKAARNFLSHLKTFATSVKTYVQGVGDITAADRKALQEKWESDEQNNEGGSEHIERFTDGLGAMYTLDMLDRKLATPKMDGERVGVTPRLVKEFSSVVDKRVHELQENFRDGLEEKCRVGAANASESAVATSDEIAASMHWATYRATLRRHGSWRRDLNVELATPFTRNIAHSWSKVFEGDLFASFEKAALDVINNLLKDVEESAALRLRDRCRAQGEVCLEEARVALQKTLDLVRDTMNNEQKEISRCLAPHVQDQLIEGYDRAMEERGAGSVARQKALFHSYVDDCKDEIFDGGADVLLSRLSNAADAIGEALDDALEQLAEKIEVSLAILWEGPRDDPKQARARKETVDVVTDILHQLQLWTQAEQMKRELA